LHLRTHAQLRYHLNLTETSCAANDSGRVLAGAALRGKVVEIRPPARSTRNR
jgi:hypothetical protein